MASATTTNLVPTAQVYYKKMLLDQTKPNFELYNHCEMFEFPKNAGRTMSMRRYAHDAVAATTSLTEGANPPLNDITSTEVTANIQEYGKVYGYTSWMTDTDVIDPEVESSITNIVSVNARRTLDTLARTEMLANGQALIGNSKTATTFASTDTMSIRDLRAAKTLMLNADVLPYEKGHYHAVLSPAQISALKADTAVGAWSDYRYTSNRQMTEGEMNNYLGCLDGIEIYHSTLVDTELINSVNAFRSFVFGKQHTGAVKLGDNFKVIHKTPGTSGISDSLDRLGSVGWLSKLAIKNLDTTAAGKNARLVVLKTA